jgi:competence protein ComEA
MSKPDEFPIMINDIKRIASLYKLGNLRSGDSIVLDSSGTVSLSRISGIKSLALRIPIGINSASIKDLEALPGIGPKLAGRIVEYRNLNGHFKAIDELRNVDGIEEKKLEHIKPFINLD